MATKIYEDATTKELVIELDGGDETRYPVFSEISRQNLATDYLKITTVSGLVLLNKTIYSDLTDSGGTPYASFAALKTALDGYFDSTV